MRALNPAGPPQSSGGQSPWPPVQMGYLFLGSSGKTPFEADIVLPQITHIVFIKKSFPLAEFEIAKSHLMGIVAKGHATVTVNAIGLAMDAELMEMEILPTHDCLDNRMQFSDRRAGLGEHSPPDHGGYVAKMNPQLVDCFGGHHGKKPILRKVVLFTEHPLCKEMRHPMLEIPIT